MIEIFLLSIVQGVTEFLPVSSSSHLIIISKFLQFNNSSLPIDLSLHIGSFIAVIFYFYKDILNFIKNKKLFIKILVASFPVMIVGFLLAETDMINKLRNIKVIGWTTLIFGILLYISDTFKMNKKIDKDLTFKSAILIGVYQILSLVPGVSRSGITITAARFQNFGRFESAKISFLLSIPTLAAVTIYGTKNIIYYENINFSILNLLCILFSFFFSFLTIKLFLQYVQKFSLKIFVIYRILLGIGILTLAYL